ncbi:MAG: His-Xaa-Ser repeat protein HxsA4 [Candidatus Omnitrophota bacterium]|nr:His-Xaa-Ser repeat protein HxsA4 [Candidatus Omnitrophota bacterium]
MKEKNESRLPRIKKQIKDFLLREEGKISKKDIAKIGISLAVLSAMFKPDSAQAASHASHNNHANALVTAGRGGHNSGTPHGSHGSHGSHSSHGSHGQW